MKVTYLYKIDVAKDMYGNNKVIAVFAAEDGTRFLWRTIDTSKGFSSLTVGNTYDIKYTVKEQLSANDYMIERVRIV